MLENSILSENERIDSIINKSIIVTTANLSKDINDITIRISTDVDFFRSLEEQTNFNNFKSISKENQSEATSLLLKLKSLLDN